jgi:hypothetical protein
MLYQVLLVMLPATPSIAPSSVEPTVMVVMRVALMPAL